jgi:ribulose kinase
MWGAYRGAPLPHLSFAEGGQSSTGRLLVWLKDLVSGDNRNEDISYKVLDEEAIQIPPGADGLVALETWQGSRTPHTDPLARGAFVGLSLSHTRAHLFRAILESVCFGTRACFDALEQAAKQGSSCSDLHKSNEVIIAGGELQCHVKRGSHARNIIFGVCVARVSIPDYFQLLVVVFLSRKEQLGVDSGCSFMQTLVAVLFS